jgi:hypothetical protein
VFDEETFRRSNNINPNISDLLVTRKYLSMYKINYPDRTFYKFLANRACIPIGSDYVIVLINYKVNCYTWDKYKYSFYTNFNTSTLLLSWYPAVLEMNTQRREGYGKNGIKLPLNYKSTIYKFFNLFRIESTTHHPCFCPFYAFRAFFKH